MLAIKFALQRVTGAVILHAIYYMSKQGIEFDYDEGSLKSLVKAQSLSAYEGGKNFSFENLSYIKAGKSWNLLELKDCGCQQSEAVQIGLLSIDHSELS